MDQIKILLVDDEEEFVTTLAERIKMRLLKTVESLTTAASLAEDGGPDLARKHMADQEQKEEKRKRYKEKLGSEIAFNGEDALKIVSDEVPDVMILDLKMPGMGGMEVLRRIRKQHPTVQVIILTGHGSEKDEKQARELGAFSYLEKPVDVDEIVAQIKAAYALKTKSH
ncbi:MAG: response regulator [bacterium]